MFGLTVMPQVVAEFGVRTEVPYAELTVEERDIVMHGPAEKRHIAVPSKNGKLGTILASGTPRLLARDPRSLTARYLGATQDSPVL
jgi:hypothetical protein